MATLEENLARLPAAIEKLTIQNKQAADDAAKATKDEGDTLSKALQEADDKSVSNKKNLKAMERMIAAGQMGKESLKKIEAKQQELVKTMASDEDNIKSAADSLNVFTTNQARATNLAAETAAATAQWQTTNAGQVVAQRKALEDLGYKAEDNKKFQRLTYKAAQDELDARLAAPGLSRAQRNEIKQEKRDLAKKDGNRLEKIAAGIGGLWSLGKKGAKAAALGGLAILSTLAIGAFMVALGNFLQSDEFKEITKYIMDVVVPKLKEFYNAFFGDGGGFIKGISALFGDKTGIGAVVAGIAGVTLLFGASKLLKLFSPLTKGIGLLFKGIGGIASKIPVVGKLMGGGDKAAKLAGQSPGAKAGSAGKKFGEVIGNIGKGLGKGIEGILRGLAMGLSAFSNPKILLGAAILAGSIVVIGAGIAAAVAIIATSLPLFARNMKKFEDLDGKKLLEVAEGIGAIGIAMMKMGGGGIAGGIGSFVKGVGGALGKLFGGEEQKSPLDQLKIFSETKIDAVQAKSNAEALGAYGIAMAKAGAGEGLGGVGAILGSVGAFFAGKEAKTPLQKLVEFGNTLVNSVQVDKNAKALGVYSKAMGEALKSAPAAGFGEALGGILGSIGSFFGAKAEPGPLDKLKTFGETEINSEQVAKNANSLAIYSKGMADAAKASPKGGIGDLMKGMLGSLAGWLGKKSPLEKMKLFGEMKINHKGVKDNVATFKEYLGMFDAKDDKSTGIDKLTKSLSELQDKLTGSKMNKAIRSMERLGKSFHTFGSIDTKDIKKLNESDLAIPVTVKGQVQMMKDAKLDQASRGAGGGVNVTNAPVNVDNSQRSTGVTNMGMPLKNPVAVGN